MHSLFNCNILHQAAFPFVQITPRNKKGPGQSINFEFDTIMHPKVEVTQAEDAASAAAASGASDSDALDGFFDAEMTVMIGGILAGGIVSFGSFLFVGFVCVQIRKRRDTTASNEAYEANATSSQQQQQSKALLQVRNPS
jgi:hypothetical protein